MYARADACVCARARSIFTGEKKEIKSEISRRESLKTFHCSPFFNLFGSAGLIIFYERKRKRKTFGTRTIISVVKRATSADDATYYRFATIIPREREKRFEIRGHRRALNRSGHTRTTLVIRTVWRSANVLYNIWWGRGASIVSDECRVIEFLGITRGRMFFRYLFFFIESITIL